MEDVDGQSPGRAQQMTGSSPCPGSSSRWLPQALAGRNSYAGELLNGEYSEDEEPPDLESDSGDVPSGSEGGSGSIILESQDLRTQIIQLLTELEETRDLALKHEDSFLEMQSILEEERLASAQQAEIFTKQIQRLQAQLRSVQEEVDSLEQEKECELLEVSQELRCAQEEIIALRQTAEEAAAERESDIASLQEELCRLRAELHELQDTRQEYEMEITTLRAEINMKSCSGHAAQNPGTLQGELQFLRDQCQHLQMERCILQESNSQLKSHLLLLEEEGDREEDTDACDGVDLAQQEQPEERDDVIEKEIPPYDHANPISLTDLEETEGTIVPDSNNRRQKVLREEDKHRLHTQLQSAEEKVQLAQSECAGLLSEIEELQQRHRLSQEEQDKLQEELRLCREEIHRLKETGIQAALWNPLVLLAVAAAVVLLCPSLRRGPY
ncbi:coiled-coil domain-containing protein 136 isoform X2 [Pelobates fuscus]|uniref:coiled-coil domain-containing protein 136 isoform X2 n=1 Tax=Pelobates fuscus TaxID=191477 RepID=UPI002FE4C5CD